MLKLNTLILALPAVGLMAMPASAHCGKCEAKHTAMHAYTAPANDEATISPAASVDLPADAKPGECFARVATPAQFETKTEQVVIREASERIEVIPAEFETVTEQVLIKPACTHVVDVPAQFKRVEEQVMIAPARSEWQYVDCKAPAPCSKPGCSKCRARGFDRVGRGRDSETTYSNTAMNTTVSGSNTRLCLVEVPAKYETVSRLEMVTPPSQRTIEHAAEYKTVTRQVVKTPAREVKIDVPAQYGTITKQEMVADAHSEWQQVDCKSGVVAQKAPTAETRVSSLQP